MIKNNTKLQQGVLGARENSGFAPRGGMGGGIRVKGDGLGKATRFTKT